MNAVINTFKDVLNMTNANDLLVQVKCEEWGREFVDILETENQYLSIWSA